MSIEPDRSIFRNVDPVTQATHLKIFILAGLLLIHISFSLFLLAPGHLSIDEAVYHLMARSFVHSGDLGIWNGYADFPSPELLLPLFQVHGGETFPPYPSLFPILAAPLYWLAGYHGLFLFNALAFVGVVWLCYATARAIFNDTDLALNASLILVLASYAWEYSQAAWPHAASTLFVLGAAYCAVRAHKTMNDRVSMAWALAAGLAAGLGTGVRLDTVFVVPALVIPFLFVSPWRPLRALVVCLGAIPGLALVSALNYFKFGVLSPFSYGMAGGGATSGLGPYLTIAAVGLVVTAAKDRRDDSVDVHRNEDTEAGIAERDPHRPGLGEVRRQSRGDTRGRGAHRIAHNNSRIKIVGQAADDDPDVVAYRAFKRESVAVGGRIDCAAGRMIAIRDHLNLWPLNAGHH